MLLSRGAATAQNGHSKSAHSTSVTDGLAAPFEGEPVVSIDLTASGGERPRNAASAWARVSPRRTRSTRNLAAGTHALQLRASFTHCAMLTGWSEHGASSSVTYSLHLVCSRGVRAEESTPVRVTGVL